MQIEMPAIEDYDEGGYTVTLYWNDDHRRGGFDITIPDFDNEDEDFVVDSDFSFIDNYEPIKTAARQALLDVLGE